MLDLSREQIADLDPEQLEFLLRRLKKAGRKEGGEPGPQPIPRRDGPGPWPLSFAQQRLWFIHQLEQRSAAYHIPIGVDLAGRLRTQLLKAALEGVAQRHEALRTTFELAGGSPVQVVHPRLDLPLPLIDLTALAEPAREAELSRLADAEVRRPFDLARGPLLRGVLVQRGAERFRLLLTLHHVAADNWSATLLMREVAAFYDSLVLGMPPALPELPVQYADFAVWQRRWLQGEVLEGQLAFWRRQLDGAPRQLELPSDRPRPEEPSFQYGRLVFRLPAELAQDLKALGRRRGTTLYNTLLAAWNVLLYRYTGQEDVVVGSPVANRRHIEIEGLIGFFVNTLLMRNRPEGRLTFEELLARVHEASLGAFAHQDLPFEKIVEDLRPDRDSSYQPLFQVMFNFYDGAMPELRFSGLEVEGVEVQIGTWNDLDLLLLDSRQGLEGYLRYSADLFEPSTAAALAESFQGLLEAIVRDPRTRLADLPLSPALAAQAEASRTKNRKQLIAVAATFTAEPLEDSFAFWMKELDIPSRVEFAPYNQVFQQLLDPASLLNGNRHGINVILVRPQDWAPEVERNVDDLIAALEAASRRAAVPFLVVLCPSSPGRVDLEEWLRLGLSGSANVHLITEGELAALYPVADLFDAYTDRIGHVPYSLTGFAALGTLISRRIHALVSPPAKVIVLDCDNTLWKGVCGEDGPLGVVLDPARKRLQELVLARQQAGLLLCLCSKNEEEDVWSTFDRRPDFPLRREHLTAWRINWEPKSKNLRSLAGELNLGLDSFVLIDDNPVECAEVRAGCPEVMVLELPADDGAIPRTLEHFWAFDRLRATAEDRERTELYHQMLERERHRRSAASFEEFLAGLGLVIDIAPMAPEQLARVAQLTQRTNQFNASTIRRTEGEVQRLLDEGSLECRVVEVRDRFGDYGLVGVALFASRGDALEVDTFLLSCRVLGRGVEHRVLSFLGSEALGRGIASVDVSAVPTVKNRPAFDFLRSVGGAHEEQREGGSVFRIPAEVARAAAFTPAAAPGEAQEGAAPAAGLQPAATPARSRRLQRIAAELFDAREVQRRIEEGRKRSGAGGAQGFVAPRTATEERLAGIFAEVLGLERVGVQDSFFDLGGHSLLGTILLSRLRDIFGIELPVRRLFELPSVALLAVEIEQHWASDTERQVYFIRPVLRDGSLPLSFSQERVWFFDRWEPNSCVFNMPAAIHLKGDLSLLMLEASLNEIVRRHEVLRARFPDISGEPVLVIDPYVHRFVSEVDLTALPEGHRKIEAKRLELREALQAFDLQIGPLMRVALLRLSLRYHVALLTLHHIVADGWSLRLLTDELSALYGAVSTNAPSPLPELPIQFVDYAVWQREWLQGDVLERELAFWREQLAGIPGSLNLPLDRPRQPVQRYHGRRLPVSFPEDLAASLHGLGRQARATIFMTLATAWKVLLRRYTTQADIAVGTLIANRHRREVESLIGFFVNTLVLRTRLAEDLSFRQALDAVRETTLDIYSHQDLPFEKLVEELNPERHLSLTPLFQVMFVLQNTPPAALELPGLHLETAEVERDIVNYDLYLTLEETADGIAGHLAWNVDLFDSTTIARMLAHFEVIVRAAVDDPGRRILDIPLLGEAERQHVLVEWNDSEVADLPSAETFLELFEAQARLRPDALAVTQGAEAISYRELRRREERLARALAGLGVGQGNVVALLADRSLDFLTAVLSLFRCGGVYLPLDPGHPDMRLRQIVAASRVPLVLVSESYVARVEAALADLPPAERPRVQRLEGLQDLPREADPRPAVPGGLAYVIYTSGSTGAPKGVMVEQRGMLNHLRAKIETLDLTDRDVVAQNASQCFDISVWQFLAALAVGGVVRIVSDGIAHDPTALLEEVEREGATILEVVPSLLRAMLDEIEGDGVPRPSLAELRWLIPTGEALPSDLCRRWLALYPHVPMLNAYGPTECSDDVSHLPIRSVSEAGSGFAPIGRPVRRTRLYVLDPWQRPTPPGVPGELCVGGEGLGRGYLLDPARTAHSFIPDSVSGAAGERLYRTGDFARLLPDGRIQFLGRLDHQIKVRGFRIEIGEIESVLHQHPSVGEAVVVARQDGPFDAPARLVAYITPAPAGEAVDGQRLRAFLGGRLPDYMVPAAFVTLDRLPLTPNGKIDLRSLPAPEATRPELVSPPRTRTEKVLAEIWRELLGVVNVGLEDSFFALGGHSLLATRVLSRLEVELGVELPVRELFEASSLEALAARIDASLGVDAAPALLPLTPAPPEEVGRPSFAQERLWFLDQFSPGSAEYNLPNAVRIQGELAPPVLVRVLNEIGRRHATLRMTFSAVAGQPRQFTQPHLSLEMPEVDLSALPTEAARAQTIRWATLHARWPFDLGRGPLVRAALLRWSPAEHVLLLNMHHIVSDGWSLGLILAEVGALYPAFAAGRPSPLPDLPFQYPDYASWQRNLLQGEVLVRQLAYWTEELAGAPPALDLPGRGSRPAVIRSNYGATRRFRLPAELSAELKALSRRQGTTLFMTLLAGFAALLNRYSGSWDLMIGVPVAGRNRPELERLVGFFVNTLVLRVRLDGAPSGEELLRRVRRAALDAFSHQDLPFEKLVAELNPERDLDRSPLFQVMFALQNAPAELVELPGLSLRRFEIDTGTIRFELYLELMEDGEELEGAVQLSLDLFDIPFALRLVEHFRTLLQGLVACPEDQIAGLPLLSEAEEAQILREWNDTADVRDVPLEVSFHSLFADVVARHPGRIAAACQGQNLTYAELDGRAGAVARHLVARGVGPEWTVPILAERGLDFLAAVVGVLRAGAAYLPLDSRHPAARLRQVLEQSRPPVVVAASPFLPLATAAARALPGGAPALLELEILLEGGPGEAPPPRGDTGNLAYVIYTSGSSGVPKGAMVEQRGMLNHLRAKIEALDLAGRDIVAQNASQCFDISVWQLLAALLVGGTVRLIPDETAHDPTALLEEVEREGITILEVVPSLLRALLDKIEGDAASRPSLARLRWIIPTGEALPSDLCQRWLALYPSVPMLNAYGPTECSDDVSHLPIRSVAEAGSGIAPIGRPVRRTQLYVLDPWQRPVPLGIPGELCVGGEGVGRGYLFDPVKTASAFVPAPYPVPSDRVYRTGDLVRFREDGNLEFLGRLDHQVKIRGFRLELGEIEAMLGEHPELSVAVVAARPDPSGGQRLVAYAVPRIPGSLAPQDLREFLRNRLPEYAIPTAWVMLDTLPLTHNGKVDRRALPNLDDVILERKRPYTAPRNEVETAVAEIFAAVIGMETVGAFDDFFDLGGHSLLATQAIWRLRESFGIELALRTLFEAPTVARLAEVIETQVLEEIESLDEENVDALLEAEPMGERSDFHWRTE